MRGLSEDSVTIRKGHVEGKKVPLPIIFCELLGGTYFCLDVSVYCFCACELVVCVRRGRFSFFVVMGRSDRGDRNPTVKEIYRMNAQYDVYEMFSQYEILSLFFSALLVLIGVINVVPKIVCRLKEWRISERRKKRKKADTQR